MVRRSARGAVAGGIRWLLDAIWGAHRAALAFDFRRLASVSIEEVGRSVSHWEALALIHEFRHERSHFWAAMKGWGHPASDADVLAHLAHIATAGRVWEPKALHEALPLPWEDRPEAEPATEDEVAVALAQLEDDVKIGGDDGREGSR